MKKLIVLAISFCLISSAFASEENHKAVKQVIENWFTAMKENNVTKAGIYLAPQFVSIHTDGIVRDKKQELKLIKNLNMKSYNLSDFKYSEMNNTIVVTYKDNGVEKIDNEQIAKGATGRMAVLQKENNKWVIIAYANMDKIG